MSYHLEWEWCAYHRFRTTLIDTVKTNFYTLCKVDNLCYNFLCQFQAYNFIQSYWMFNITLWRTKAVIIAVSPSIYSSNMCSIFIYLGWTPEKKICFRISLRDIVVLQIQIIHVYLNKFFEILVNCNKSYFLLNINEEGKLFSNHFVIRYIFLNWELNRTKFIKFKHQHMFITGTAIVGYLSSKTLKS